MSEIYKLSIDSYLKVYYPEHQDSIKNHFMIGSTEILIKHQHSVHDAIAKYNLSTLEYNRLHANKYGLWGSDEFNQNFPGMFNALIQ